MQRIYQSLVIKYFVRKPFLFIASPLPYFFVSFTSFWRFIFELNVEKICFEITETAAIQNLIDAAEFINQLKSFGCSFALDDFGSGLSSFGYLKKLPVDYLKIDGMFVREILNDEADRVFVQAIISIAKAMGIKTVAEFVENDEIYELVEGFGVDYVQGYGVHRPEKLSFYEPTPMLGSDNRKAG